MRKVKGGNMVQMIIDKGETSIKGKGTNFELMVQASVLIEEFTAYLISDCDDYLKERIVAMFRDSINFAITEGSK